MVFQMVNSNKFWNMKSNKSFNPLRMYPPLHLNTTPNLWKLLSKRESLKDSSPRIKKVYSTLTPVPLSVMIPSLKNIGISILLLKKLPKVLVPPLSTLSCTTPPI